MNYYEHHIGDYAAATSHLSLIEDAVYSRMLRQYYLREEPLPEDWRKVARLVGAKEEVELEAVRAVLDEFFTLEADGYRQKRADEVIAAFHAYQDDRAEERENEADRKRRYRERRAQLFEQLREIGVVPPFNTPTDELVRMLSHGTRRGQDGDGTATHLPLTTYHLPEDQKHVQRTAARFDEFWSGYPEKKGRKEALKAWKAKGCDAIADQIIAHVKRMQAEDRGWLEGYVPHGSTYVNGERWTDEPKLAQPARAGPSQSKTLTAIQKLEAMKHGLAENGNSDGIPKAALPWPGTHASGVGD